MNEEINRLASLTSRVASWQDCSALRARKRGRSTGGKPLIDLFCGCGGASTGYLWAGFEHYAAFDFDTDALMSYHLLTGCKATYANLAVKPLRELISPSFQGVFHLSPPCTEFTKLHHGPYSSVAMLLPHTLSQILWGWHQSWIVLENVDNILSRSHKQMVDAMIKMISLAREIPLDRERLERFVLNAADFGVPQNRKRFILVIPPHGYPIIDLPRRTVRNKLTFRDAIGREFKGPGPQ